MEDSLFPDLPEDLSGLNDEELSQLLDEHNIALAKIEAEDETYIGGLSGPQVIAALEAGVEQIKTLKDEQAERVAAAVAYEARKAELFAEAKATEDEVEAETLAEAEVEPEPEVAPEPEHVEPEPVVAAATERVYRRAPLPATSASRTPVAEPPVRTVLVASAGVDGVTPGAELDRIGLANAMVEHVKRRARPSKHAGGTEERTLVASAHFAFPPERVLRPNDIEGNNAKIRSIGSPFLGVEGRTSLVASGGLCAPLEPFYEIPDFAVTDRPVRDALPSFMAERGGISVPSVSTIGDITTAITVIEEEDDAAGGSFATKSCQDLDCPTWTDVAVGAIAHCREYGNFNARAWPEGIAHENNLTMAAHSRTADARLLDRIKALSVNVTTTQVYNAVYDLVYGVARAGAGLRYRLRLTSEPVMLRALLPAWVIELLMVDVAATQFDRYQTRANIVNYLRQQGIEPAFYLDTPSSGTSQGFTDQTAGALQDFPDNAQWALYVEGAFLHLDAGVLELGIVRDSTLNSTNDYQVFGETFENVARIGPTQAALWVTSPLCPSGEFPALTTALSC